MSPEKQRIAIAEACGWIFDPVYYTEGPPDYLNDLNAMHEAEKVLTKEQWPAYVGLLCQIASRNPRHATDGPLLSGNQVVVHAAADEKAEALLVALGKWEEVK